MARARRTLYSYMPTLGFVKRPSGLRPQGISVMMWTKDEEEWIKASILSMKDFADEIVVADASKDSTPEIIRSVAEEYEFAHKVKLMHQPPDRGDIAYEANRALKNTTYRWISVWGGDFVARTSGQHSVEKLRKRILSLPDRYFMIYYPLVGLDGDLFHVARERPLLVECRSYTYSPELEYAYRPPKGFESILFPKYYRRILFPEACIFHCKVDPPEDFLWWRFWTEWRFGGYLQFANLHDYVRHRVMEEWHTDDYELAKAICFVEYAKNLEMYDKERFGEYPALLKQALKNPRCRILYRDGRVIGRSDMVRLPSEILESIHQRPALPHLPLSKTSHH